MVLLIKPEAAETGFSLDMALKTEPLELEYIKAALAQNKIKSYIYDASFEKVSIEALMRRWKVEAVAITGYITQEYKMLSYARRAKKCDPNVITLIGGCHAQRNPEHFMKPEVSYICRSDNVYGVVEVLKAESGKKALKDLEQIDGLCYLIDGKWKKNKLSPFDINLLPMPDRGQFSRYSKHYRYLDVAPIALIKTASSCPYTCSFCYGRALNDGVYCKRDIDKVVEEIKDIPCENIQIADDDFLLDERRLTTFIQQIREKQIHKTFICYGRSDFIAEHPKLIKELVSIGFRYFMVGLEAVNDENLLAYHKKNTMDNNKKTIKLLRQLHVNLVGLFIVDIHFKKKDFRNLRAFIKKYNIKYTGVSIFTPVPGTELFKEYEDKLITEDMEKWDFMHLVVPPVYLSKFQFYFEYFLLVMDLFHIAQKAGIYRFVRLKDYKAIFWKLLWKEGIKH